MGSDNFLLRNSPNLQFNNSSILAVLIDIETYIFVALLISQKLN